MINRGRYSLFADSFEVSARALDLVGRSTVVDMLGLLTLDWPKLYRWFREPESFTENDFLKLQWSGVKAFHPAVHPDQPEPHGAAREWMAGWNQLLSGQPKRLRRIEAPGDFALAIAEGRIGILLGFQNADHFRTARDVEDFHRLGQRVSQLTYNERNRLGSGCKAPQDDGLTRFGAEVVAEMNHLGMAVDVSHCGERTSLEAVAASKKPVLITHSNAHALVPHPRCKSDAVIRAVAGRGGVMGISFIPAFASPRPSASLGDVLDHFHHVARLVGVEHVGLGSDADIDALDPRTGRVRSRYVVQGVHHARRTFELTEGLLRRGYGDEQVALILGGNFTRALGDIWDVAPPPPPKVARPKLPGESG